MQLTADFVKGLADVSAKDLNTSRSLYSSYYSQTRDWPFPGYRQRHRRLLALCGVLQLTAPPLPAWWHKILALAPDEVRGVLSTMPAWDLYQGQLNPEHFAQLKERAGDVQEKPGWARSPRLSRILASFLPGEKQHELYRQFEQRGNKLKADTPLVVSAHPWDILSMGCSRHFSTCQDLTGKAEGAHYQNAMLPANLLDNGMVVAYTPDEGSSDRWDLQHMHTRTILRLLWSPGARNWGVLIDRFYGDAGQMEAIRHTLALRFAQLGLAHFSPPRYYQHKQGVFLDVASPSDMLLDARGPRQPFGDHPNPYLDQYRANSYTFRWEPVPADATYRRLIASVIVLPAPLA